LLYCVIQVRGLAWVIPVNILTANAFQDSVVRFFCSGDGFCISLCSIFVFFAFGLCIKKAPQKRGFEKIFGAL
ncbi:hypothetical protein KJ764_00705, partial [Patescibacteria group bacterium]|nr:hypothetical protein [Patescibacteria group bacterium]